MSIIPLHAEGQGLAPATPERGEIAGRPVVLSLGDPDAEYAALRTGALLVDRSYRSRTIFPGVHARAVLTGLVTNDILALPPGAGCYACALTAKGKIVTDLRVFAREQDILVDVPPRSAIAWSDMLRKYVNPRQVKIQDASAELSHLGVYGIESRAFIAEATGVEPERLADLPPYGHVEVPLDDSTVLIARVPDLILEGYELFVRAGAAEALSQRLVSAGARPGGLEAFDIARVESGRPEFGVDMDEATIPQEANMEELHAISFTKGCYTGQETVARVHFRGHVNRHLRGIRHANDAPIPPGATLEDPTGKNVGDVRSSLASPRLGGIALAMVRRETDLPASVTARWEGGSCEAMIYALPFPI